MVMNDVAPWLRRGFDDDPNAYDPSGRLAAYEARTQTPLDLLAVLTLWIVLIPPWDFGHNVEGIWWTIRIALSVVYGIDLTICSVLARRHVRYAFTHPLVLASVVFPPVRVIFSFRLVRSMFRRGNLRRFLIAAVLLVLNGSVIVYLLERHAPNSNIHTLGESVWFSLVTTTTVGYGDYTPVTPAGRVTACFIMVIGLLTLAIITAQVASSFVAQGPSRARRDPQPQAAPAAAAPPEAASPEVTLAELDRRLARIEELLLAAAPSSQGTTPRGGPGGE
jgi:voltage-gated potassium channel